MRNSFTFLSVSSAAVFLLAVGSRYLLIERVEIVSDKEHSFTLSYTENLAKRPLRTTVIPKLTVASNIQNVPSHRVKKAPPVALPQKKEKHPWKRNAHRLVVNPTSSQIYEVKRGDTFQKISSYFYGTTRYYAKLEKANPNLRANSLRPGVRVLIPVSSGLRKTESVELYSKASTRTYVVKTGDTLSEIAAKELGSAKKTKSILKLNLGLKVDKLRVGQTIYLPTYL